MAPKQPGKKILVEPTFGEKMESWYEINGKWINIVLGIVVVGVLGWVITGTLRTRAENAANVDFRKAVIQYEMGLMAPEEDQKIDQIQGSITAAQEVVEKHGDRFVGRQAQLLIGNAHYNIALAQTGEGVDALEKARAGYEKYLSMATNDRERAVGNVALGNVLENLGFIRSDESLLEQAVVSYEKAKEQASGTSVAGEATLALARVQLALNKPDASAKAAALYKEVIEQRDTQLVSDETLENLTAIELASGTNLTQEKVVELINLSAWSQKAEAEDGLSRLK